MTGNGKRTPVAERVTDTGSANEQLLYFTSSSLTADDRNLVFISDRTGVPNLFRRDLATGEERQLSTNTVGFLKSYVYFNGLPYQGLGKASVSLDVVNGIVYYIEGRKIWRAAMDGSREPFASYPAGQMTAFTHVSADGRFLCVPTTDAAALMGDVPLPGRPDTNKEVQFDVDQRIRDLGLSSWLRVYDTRDGSLVSCERVPAAWVTHVQFSPVNANWILYNNEWCTKDSGKRRIWLWDGSNHHRMRPLGDGRSAADWTCHEMWERDGTAIIYHGKYKDGPAYLGRVTADRSAVTEIPLPDGWERYGHFTVGTTGQLVSDGYFKADEQDDAPVCPWISTLKVDWDRRTAEWNPLCRHDSSWDCQDSHPHPILNHSCSYVYFTSDADGQRAVYRCGIS